MSEPPLWQGLWERRPLDLTFLKPGKSGLEWTDYEAPSFTGKGFVQEMQKDPKMKGAIWKGKIVEKYHV